MSIVGVIVILTLPYMAGYILTRVLNIKETSQIETYLTGFFFVFLLQSLVFIVSHHICGGTFLDVCKAYNNTISIVIALFLLIFTMAIIKNIKAEKHDDTYHAPIHRDEWIIIGIMVTIFILVIVKIIVLKDYIRTDLMLATVKTTLNTDTIYEYNPIISQPFTLGLIGSKKIVALPIYYAYLSRSFRIDAAVLLYTVLTIQTIFCTYLSCALFIAPILRNRRKVFMFACFLGALILSGDYFTGSIGAKLCWNGYSGEAIVPCVMIPYLMYIITDFYRLVRDNERQMEIRDIIISSLKLGLCIIPSFFITSITTGILLLVLNGIVLTGCCIFRYKKEESV